MHGKLSIKVYQKLEHRFMYIPFKSAHPRRTIKNYILSELIRCEDKIQKSLISFKTKLIFSKECVTAGSRKISYHIGFQQSNIHLEPNITTLTQKIFVISRECKKRQRFPPYQHFVGNFQRSYVLEYPRYHEREMTLYFVFCKPKRTKELLCLAISKA